MEEQKLKQNPHLFSVPAYVPGKSIEETQRELGLAEIIKLGSNENPLGPSPKAIEAIRVASSDLHQYPSVELQDLRLALAQSIGPEFGAGNIIVGNGSANVILSLAQAYLHGGGEVVISHPAFQMYALATTMYGGTPVFVEADGYRCDLQAMAEAINGLTRMVYITNPNNPTGLMITQEEIEAFMAQVPPWVVVIIDEAYADFADDDNFPHTWRYILAGRNLIVTRTFSKIYGLAGLRVGYGVGREELIEHLARTQPPFHTGRLTLVAALAALADQEHVKRTYRLTVEGREYYAQQFENMGLHYLPSQANFIMLVDLPYDVNDINLAMLKRGIIIRPTAPFGLPQGLRITIGTPEQNKQVVAALQEVLKELGRG
jgi:histidinol-phosphate aminotransferase